ncbi:transglycosylase domain-containing protein [Niveibacterium sp. SC-1]|uniref:transglycosylase domain-containing protein n=1 Tax=Niveibacterium sp. SC-1 TaxID=3135646 RepID=UPI00311E10A3
MRHTLLLLASLVVLPLHAATLPRFDEVRAHYTASDAVLSDRNGRPLADLRFDSKVRRFEWVPLAQFSPALKEALITSEDKRFFEHDGVDWKAFVGALWHNLWNQSQRGASTLTMQLAGLLDPNIALPNRPGGRRSFEQKWDQGLAAEELERSWSKAQILEAYLNLAPFRGDLQGVHAASAVLFGKTPAQIDRAEAQLITAILPSPNARAERIAKRACARANQLRAADLCPRIRELSVRLDTPRDRPRYALAPHLARRVLSRGGDHVASTLDADEQEAALEGLRAVLPEAGSLQAGVLVLDNQDASIRAWVGGPQARGEDAILQRSVFPLADTPFAAALAVEKRNASAASLLQDETSDPPWRSLRVAVQEPRARSTLALETTAADGLPERLAALGMDASRLPAIELGAQQAAAALRAFVTGGSFQPAHWQPQANGVRQVWRADTSFILADILAEARARPAPGDSGDFPGALRWSLESEDSYASLQLVATSQRTVVVTVSNAQRASDSAERLALRIQREVLRRLALAPDSGPRPPANVQRSLVAFEPAVEAPRREWFLHGTEIVLSRPPGDADIDLPLILHPLARDGVVELAADESLVLEASAGAQGARWWINGQALGEGLRLAWNPVAGHYLLQLRGPNGENWDRREFTLRRTP